MEKTYNYARDAFIYLLSYATLLISTIAFNFLIKSLIDRVIPDITEMSGFMRDDRSIIGFLAAVIIAFPIFWYINLRANKMLKDGTMRANTGVRHWLIYITLVIVILVIIWQLIALFMTFLQGGVAARFLIHTFVTLIIAVMVLAYQWWHLKHFDGTGTWSPRIFKIFEWKVVVLVVGIIVWAFMSIGSPAEQRSKRFDEMRVERLRGIQWAIDDFYGFKNNENFGRLPRSLEELKNNNRFFIEEDALVDPTTKEAFEYIAGVGKNYQLCAVFETVNTVDDMPQIRKPGGEFGGQVSFEHEAERTCFDLTVR